MILVGLRREDHEMNESRPSEIYLKLMKLMPIDGCTMCNQEFLEGDKTYGGVTENGKVEFVGECCKHELVKIYVCGFVSV